MAAVTKFTSETRGAILAALRIGVGLERTAQAAGVSRQTLWRWLRRAMREEENGEETEYVRFAVAVGQVDGEILGQVESNIVQASREDWRAGAWYLSRRLLV